MTEGVLSYCISFLTFIQFAIALDFGFMYLERKSSVDRLSDKFYDGYKNIINFAIEHAQCEIDRNRRKNATDNILMERDLLKRTKDKVLTKTDSLSQLGFLSPIGVVAGIYGVGSLYVVCLFGRDEFYQDLFLVNSEITLVTIFFIFVLIGLCKCRPHVLRYAFLYVIALLVGLLMLFNGWCLAFVTNFELWFNCFVIIPYLPVILFIIFLVYIYAKRIPMVINMIKHTRILHSLFEQQTNH